MAKLISVDEAARMLGIRRESVYRLLRKGKLTRTKVELGNRTLIDPGEVKRLMQPQAGPR